jgi:hypothetical protein
MGLAYLALTLLVLDLGLMLALVAAQTRLLFPAHLVTSDGPALPASVRGTELRKTAKSTSTPFATVSSGE